MPVTIEGISLGMITPFTPENEIDTEGIHENLSFALTGGINSVSPVATSGEGSLLSETEYAQVIETVVKCVAGSISVFPGAPGGSPDSVISKAQTVRSLGADGIYVSTPPYAKPTQAGLMAHFSAVLETVDLPVVIYNAAHRSAVDMSPEVVAELFEKFPNFAAYKVTSLSQMARVLHLTDQRLTVIAEDFAFLPALALGASAVGSVAANVIPRLMSDIYESFQNGDLATSRRLFLGVIPLMQALGTGGGGTDTSPAPIKTAMGKLELASGHPRLPLVPSSNDTEAEITRCLDQLKPHTEMD